MNITRLRRYPALVFGISCSLVLWCGEAFGAFPGRNGRIAYSESVGEDTYYDAVRTILPNGRDDSGFFFGAKEPAYSADGRMVVVSGGALASDSPAERRGLFLARADERGNARRITRDFRDQDPAFAPGGDRIVFERNGQLRIYFRHHSRPLTTGGDPSWSPRGIIAFGKGAHIYVVRPGGGGLRRVATGSAPNWSPDGRRIVYALGSGPYRLATIRADGTSRRILARSRSNSFGSPCWSPDGRFIAFAFGSTSVRVLPSSGGRSHHVVEAEDFSLHKVDWQPLTTPR